MDCPRVLGTEHINPCTLELPMRFLLLLTASLIGTLTALAVPAAPVVGPPAVCFPFEIGSAKTIPDRFSKEFTHENLVPKTLAVLGQSDNTLVHMETLRRAVSAMMESKRSVKTELLAERLVSSLRWRLLEHVASGEQGLSQQVGQLWFDLAFGQLAISQALRSPNDGGEVAMAKAMEYLANDGAAQLGCGLAMWEFDQRGEFGFDRCMLKALEIESQKGADEYLLRNILSKGEMIVGEAKRAPLVAKLKSRIVRD